jgi:multicomponent Na+:H+ antiporter subunit D
MVGVPLTAGFLTKYHLAVGGLEAGWWAVVPALLISSLLTAVYVWRILQHVWFAPADVEAAVAEEVPWTMRLPALVLAAACVVFGVTSISIDLALDAARALLG